MNAYPVKDFKMVQENYANTFFVGYLQMNQSQS